MPQPRFCVGRYRLGQAYYNLASYDSAEAQLRGVADDEADGCNQLQEAHHLLGMTYLRLDRTDEAKQAFTRCRDIDPASDIGTGCAETLAGL